LFPRRSFHDDATGTESSRGPRDAERGFNLIDVSEPVTDADFEALTIDWDAVLAARQITPLVASAA
jgi:hypothetical protein